MTKSDKYLRRNVSNMRMGNRKIQWGDNVGNGNGDILLDFSYMAPNVYHVTI